jgi:hypothetical protein
LAERRYRYFWCDGFIPNQYLLDGPKPRITGRVWIGNGGSLSEWGFDLLLRHPPARVEDIDWAGLLPPSGVTCWMWFDEKKRLLEIDPAAARPDLA